jgi:hypothetical protein
MVTIDKVVAAMIPCRTDNSVAADGPLDPDRVSKTEEGRSTASNDEALSRYRYDQLAHSTVIFIWRRTCREPWPF